MTAFGGDDSGAPTHLRMWKGIRLGKVGCQRRLICEVLACAMGSADQKPGREKVVDEESLRAQGAPSFSAFDQSSSQKKASLFAQLLGKQKKADCCHYSLQRQYPPRKGPCDKAGMYPEVLQHSCETLGWDIPWDCWNLSRLPPKMTSVLVVRATTVRVSFAWT